MFNYHLLTSQQIENTSILLGKYLTLKQFCTCTQTYNKYADKINPWPHNIPETLPALVELNTMLLDPIIDQFGVDNFRLTYGFCSIDLKRYLEKIDPDTGQKNGRVAPTLDQHMAYEKNARDNYHCKRGGAACDFYIVGVSTEHVIDWIVRNCLPFDSLYFYHSEAPLHISYGPAHKRDIWAFTAKDTPTKKGIEHWQKLMANCAES